MCNKRNALFVNEFLSINGVLSTVDLSVFVHCGSSVDLARRVLMPAWSGAALALSWDPSSSEYLFSSFRLPGWLLAVFLSGLRLNYLWILIWSPLPGHQSLLDCVGDLAVLCVSSTYQHFLMVLLRLSQHFPGLKVKGTNWPWAHEGWELLLLRGTGSRRRPPGPHLLLLSL